MPGLQVLYQTHPESSLARLTSTVSGTSYTFQGYVYCIQHIMRAHLPGLQVLYSAHSESTLARVMSTVSSTSWRTLARVTSTVSDTYQENTCQVDKYCIQHIRHFPGLCVLYPAHSVSTLARAMSTVSGTLYTFQGYKYCIRHILRAHLPGLRVLYPAYPGGQDGGLQALCLHWRDIWGAGDTAALPFVICSLGSPRSDFLPPIFSL